MEKFKKWGYIWNLTIDDELDLAAFLAMWLSNRVFGDSSTTVRPETFLMDIKMAWGKKYSLAIPYLACADSRLGSSKTNSQSTRNYRPWALIIG